MGFLMIQKLHDTGSNHALQPVQIFRRRLLALPLPSVHRITSEPVGVFHEAKKGETVLPRRIQPTSTPGWQS